MRISTNTFFDTSASRITNLQSELSKVQDQLSSGRRILTPSDDPVAAARALELTQAQATNAQYNVNRRNAADALNTEESALSNVTSLLQDLKTSVIQAGNGSLDDTQRNFIATQLAGRLDDLIGLANTTDGSGAYIFSGYQTSTQPFTKDATKGAIYNGDQGARVLQVGAQRQFAVNDSGDAVFSSIRGGNGIFVTGTDPNYQNQGSGVISTGSATSSSPLTGTYTIQFDPTDPTIYTVVDQNSNQVSSGTFKSGTTISFAGIQVQITGTPSVGDKFTVAPSTNNQSVFTALNDLVNLLKTPVVGTTGQANLAQGLQTAQNLIGNTLDKVMTVRASVGSRLNEIDTLNTQGDDKDAQYAQSISNLQDLDYTKAVSDLTKQKVMLEAVQQSFVQTANLSLFKFI